MKKLIILLTSCLLILIASCATVPNAGTGKAVFSDETVDKQIKQLVTLWSVKASQLDETTFNMLFDTWAQVVWMDGGGKKQYARQEAGITELLKNKLYSSVLLSDVPVDSIKINHRTVTGSPQAVITLVEPKTRVLFEFSKPEDQDSVKKIKIEKLFIFEYYEDNLKPGDFQQWADSNKDGYLDQEEQETLYTRVIHYQKPEGPVRDSLDQYFDLNDDGYIDDIEFGYAEDVLHFDQLHRMYSTFPYFAKTYVDTDEGGDNYISIHLANGFYDEVFNPDFSRFGRRNTQLRDKMADVNHDGYVNREELAYYVHLVGMKLSLMPAPPVAPKDTPVLHNEILKWADFNGDRTINYYEVDDVAWKLYEFLANFHTLALNPLDSFFNLNQNFFIEKYEKEYAFTYLLSHYLNDLKKTIPDFVKNFMDINSNGEIEPNEIKDTREFLFITTNTDQGRENKLDIDAKVDVNHNGRIDWQEFDDFWAPLSSALANAWLNDSSENTNMWDVLTNLDELSDLDHNGTINGQERNQVAEAFRREHKVASAFDKLIDSDNNGIIDKYDIEKAQQLGMEVTQNIEMPVSTRSGNARSTQSRGSGKTLAIVKSTSPDKELEKSVGEVILSFIQNAFIASGNYRIVDRRNLDAVMGEQNLSLSGLIKESDAVEVGQIAGAELVGVAELYRLDNNYFLNLKLINSTSGEVVNSSIAQAGAIGEFLSMCTQAVNTLKE